MIIPCDRHGMGYVAGCEGCRQRARGTRAKYRADHPDYWRDNETFKTAKGGKRSLQSYKTLLVATARSRARKTGLEATITQYDVEWPTHCPVLGHELDYRISDRTGIPHKHMPSLDRKDNTKGYVPGNVFVICLRANEIKRDATPEELEAVLKYTRD